MVRKRNPEKTTIASLILTVSHCDETQNRFRGARRQQGIKSKTLPAGARKPSADTPHRSNMDVGLVDALCDYSRPVFLFGERPEYPYRMSPPAGGSMMIVRSIIHCHCRSADRRNAT